MSDEENRREALGQRPGDLSYQAEEKAVVLFLRGTGMTQAKIRGFSVRNEKGSVGGNRQHPGQKSRLASAGFRQPFQLVDIHSRSI